MTPSSAPDIFLSYSRQDLGIAGKMAAALKAAGHVVWWDQALKSGEIYDRVTETALREARVVIVLWSKAAVASDWVRSEATDAMQRGALMPVMIENCQRPVMFELRQSADLTGWKGNAKDPRLAAFLADVARQLATPEASKPVPAPVLRSSTGPSRRLLIGGAALGAAAMAGGGWWLLRPTAAHAANTSIAVLPFANLSGDASQAYFSDGIAEELRSSLSRIAGLQVAARASSELMRAADIPTAAEKLGVANIVTGSVRTGSGTIRIGAQLVDGGSGLVRWSDTYDRAVGDVLAIEAGIAENIANALNIVLGRAERQLLSAGGTTNPAAHDAYLRGSALEAAQKPFAALPEYAAAVAADPNYALAVAGHASIACWLAIQFTSRPEAALVIAAAEARRAVALAPRLGAPHAILGFILFAQLKFREAEATFGTAVRLAPNDAFLLGRYSIYLGAIGRADEAVPSHERSPPWPQLR